MNHPTLEIVATHNRHYPLCFHSGILYSRRGTRLYKWPKLDGSPQVVGRLDLPGFQNALSRFRPLERLLRLGISHLVTTSAGWQLAIANKRIFRADGEGGAWHECGRVRVGSRPMRFGATAPSNDCIYIAEYFSNAERDIVRLLAVSKDGQVRNAYEFPRHAIRHIHLVQYDPFADSLWVATGDYGRECRILQSEGDFETLRLVGSGDQSWRATCLLFARDAVYWGMDSPTERAFIVRWDRLPGKREFVAELPGPIWHWAINEDGWFTFSTTVEPSVTLKDNRAHIWSGKGGRNFAEVASYEKDAWSGRWFQFGLVYFPLGVAPDDYLVFCGNALKGCDNEMIVGRLRA